MDIEICPSLIKNQTHAVAHSLRGDGFDASEDGTGRGTPLVVARSFSFDADQSENPKATHQFSKEHTAPLIKARALCVGTQSERSSMAVRRLTPRECERLQGFPDDWTLIPYRKKPAEACPDGPRYKALGNSMAVPVMAWIGQRLAQVEAIQ